MKLRYCSALKVNSAFESFPMLSNDHLISLLYFHSSSVAQSVLLEVDSKVDFLWWLNNSESSYYTLGTERKKET